MEFLKSPKRLPVPFSARQYDFRRNKWAFGQASDQQIASLLRRKVYWQSRLGAEAVWIADSTDAQYLGTSPGHLVEVANTLGELVKVEGEHARALAPLLAQAEEIQTQMRSALEALERKHAFERG